MKRSRLPGKEAAAAGERVVHRGTKESAEWVAEVLRHAGVESEVRDRGRVGYEVVVDEAETSRATGILARAEEESRRRVAQIAAGLRRSALKALVPAAIVGAVELLVNQRPYDRLLPWLMLVWAVAFVLFARRDARERGRDAAAQTGTLR